MRKNSVRELNSRYLQLSERKCVSMSSQIVVREFIWNSSLFDCIPYILFLSWMSSSTFQRVYSCSDESARKHVFIDITCFACYSSIMRVGIYARVSTQDQQTLPMQLTKMKEYIENRKWTLTVEVEEVGSGAKTRPKREELLKMARRREIDAILVWKLDRFGRSLADLVTTLSELRELGVIFVSLTESLDFSTPSGRAMAGMLSTFAEFERDIIRERVIAGIANARANGKAHGRPKTAGLRVNEIRKLKSSGLNNSQIARKLHISRGSVISLLRPVPSS